MAYERKAKKKYTRSQVSSRYRNVEAMMVDGQFDILRRELVTLPAAGSVRPIAFGVYDELANKTAPATNVICSGTPILIGAASGGGHRIGITAEDGVAGEKVTAFTNGKFFLPLDWKGDSAATPARVKASAKGSLSGKPAYYLKDLGYVTDQVPAVGGQAYLRIGNFVDESKLREPENLYGWHSFAVVDIFEIQGETAEALPTAAAITHAGTVAVFPSVSTFVGLTVDFYVNAVNSDPWIEYTDAQISTAVQGVATPFIGNIFSHTFGAAGSFTVDITVGGTTFNYSVTVAVLSAPSIVAV